MHKIEIIDVMLIVWMAKSRRFGYLCFIPS
jgi:hypothetical protein